MVLATSKVLDWLTAHPKEGIERTYHSERRGWVIKPCKSGRTITEGSQTEHMLHVAVKVQIVTTSPADDGSSSTGGGGAVAHLATRNCP